jgi:hypothetical protein
MFAFSIGAPFAIFHKDVNLMKDEKGKDAIPSTSITHSLFMYTGITKNKREQLARELAAVKIAMYENSSQFMLIFYEMFNNRETVTWVQSSFIIISLSMISKTIAPKLAQELYPLIARPSKECEKTDYTLNYLEDKIKKSIEYETKSLKNAI